MNIVQIYKGSYEIKIRKGINNWSVVYKDEGSEEFLVLKSFSHLQFTVTYFMEVYQNIVKSENFLLSRIVTDTIIHAATFVPAKTFLEFIED